MTLPTGDVLVPSEDGSTPARRRRRRHRYAVAPDGTLVWSFATEGAIDSSPAIGPTGEVVVGSRDGSVYCFR